MARLAKLPNIVGVKDATADLARPLRTRLAIGEEFCQLSGEDAHRAGVPGAGRPRLHLGHRQRRAAPCAEMHEAWREGGLDEALAINERLMPLHQALFCETSPAPVKYAPACSAAARAEVRLPLAPISRRHAREGARGDGHGRPAQLSRIGHVSPDAHGARRRLAQRVAAQNRKARHDYLIEDTLEAGLMLTGTEVKSLRGRPATIAEAHAGEKGGELWLFNAYIPEYQAATASTTSRAGRASCCCTEARGRQAVRRRPARGHDRSCRSRSISTPAAAPRSSSASPRARRPTSARR